MRNEYRVPLSRCRRCKKYKDGYCDKQDLEPCAFVPKKNNAIERIVYVVILLGFFLGIIIFTSCSRAESETPNTHFSAVELLRGQRDELSSFQKLTLAIAFTESRFNPDAIGKAQDLGILQITPIYVKELNRLGFDYSHEDALNIDKSIEMFNAMQSVKNPTKDIDLAILYHNKSDSYKARVKENLELIERYEAMRKRLR